MMSQTSILPLIFILLSLLRSCVAGLMIPKASAPTYVPPSILSYTVVFETKSAQNPQPTVHPLQNLTEISLPSPSSSSAPSLSTVTILAIAAIVLVVLQTLACFSCAIIRRRRCVSRKASKDHTTSNDSSTNTDFKRIFIGNVEESQDSELINENRLARTTSLRWAASWVASLRGALAVVLPRNYGSKETTQDKKRRRRSTGPLRSSGSTSSSASLPSFIQVERHDIISELSCSLESQPKLAVSRWKAMLQFLTPTFNSKKKQIPQRPVSVAIMDRYNEDMMKVAMESPRSSEVYVSQAVVVI